MPRWTKPGLTAKQEVPSAASSAFGVGLRVLAFRFHVGALGFGGLGFKGPRVDSKCRAVPKDLREPCGRQPP